MDYKTKPASRRTLRRLSVFLRRIFNLTPDEPFPVLSVLEQLPDKFRDCDWEVLEDSDFPSKVMARCLPNDRGGFTIQIKESVYAGAYERQVGAYLGFICHEICHVFLFKVGYTPVYERSFQANELPAYESVEWQAKALCGEVMMPYNATRGMDANQIADTYHVSKESAKMRLQYEGRGGESSRFENKKDALKSCR